MTIDMYSTPNGLVCTYTSSAIYILKFEIKIVGVERNVHTFFPEVQLTTSSSPLICSTKPSIQASSGSSTQT